jgi:hypothetical protein
LTASLVPALAVAVTLTSTAEFSNSTISTSNTLSMRKLHSTLPPATTRAAPAPWTASSPVRTPIPYL